MKNALGKLILESLKRADGHTLPETTLVTTLTPMVAPPAERNDFTDSFTLLLQRDLIGFKNDEVSEERHFFLKDKGEAYVRKH
jgi:hypothetical protein